MQYETLDEFLKLGSPALARGPVALVFVEDEVEVDSTLRHHLDLGFRSVIAFTPQDIAPEPQLSERIYRVTGNYSQGANVFDTINRIIDAAPGVWMYYCFNAEYLYYPFCETRTIGEMLAFHGEERRDAMLSYVIDLYAGDLDAYPGAVSLDQAMLDRTGYYAQSRYDAENKRPFDRQLDFSGGLRWRFEEHVPYERRRIDRIAIFKSKPGLRIKPNHTFSDQEYNTYSCPWHHNLTASICSFRAAKALRRNPGSRNAITSFRWRNSVPFEWHSQQLLDLGLMEPGQWF